MGTKHSWDSELQISTLGQLRSFMAFALAILGLLESAASHEVDLPKIAYRKLHNTEEISGSEYFSMIVLPAIHLVPRLPIQ